MLKSPSIPFRITAGRNTITTRKYRMTEGSENAIPRIIKLINEPSTRFDTGPARFTFASSSVLDAPLLKTTPVPKIGIENTIAIADI